MSTLYRWKRYGILYSKYRLLFGNDDSGLVTMNGFYRNYSFNTQTGLISLLDPIANSSESTKTYLKTHSGYIYNKINGFTYRWRYDGYKDRSVRQQMYAEATTVANQQIEGPDYSNSYPPITSTSRTAYPQNGASGSYWYIYDGIANRSPVISGEDFDLGSKLADFVIPYTVTDADGNAVTVSIKVDGVTKVSGQSVTLGRSYEYAITLSEFSLGQHSVVITASDGTATSTRTYWFTKSNTAPQISGEDLNLGGKSVAFTLNFTVADENGDDVAVSVILDGTEIQNVTGAQDQSLSVTVTNEQLAAMEVGSTHTLTIKADDGKGGIAYRRYTFTRVNRAPVISESNADLGELAEPPSIEYSATDAEQDEITVEVLLNGTVVQEAAVVEDNEVYTYTIAHGLWIKLPYGQHTVTIKAWDANSAGNPTMRLYTFTRIAGGLEVIVKINEFDTQPTKVIAVPHGMFADDAVTQVFVCNNFLDETPTWEDASEMSRIARAHIFTNAAKTAGKWAIGIRVVIENGPSGVSSVLRGLKGGYE